MTIAREEIFGPVLFFSSSILIIANYTNTDILYIKTAQAGYLDK